METYEEEAIQDSEIHRIEVNHCSWGIDNLDYIMLPDGYWLNRDVKTAKRGDIIEFNDGSERYFFSCSRICINSSIANNLCHKRYRFGISKMLSIWRDMMVASRKDIKGLNQEECLVVFYSKDKVRYE